MKCWLLFSPTRPLMQTLAPTAFLWPHLVMEGHGRAGWNIGFHDSKGKGGVWNLAYLNIGKFLATIMAPYSCCPRLETEMIMAVDVVVMM